MALDKDLVRDKTLATPELAKITADDAEHHITQDAIAAISTHQANQITSAMITGSSGFSNFGNRNQSLPPPSADIARKQHNLVSGLNFQSGTDLIIQETSEFSK